MYTLKCKMCGGDLQVIDGENIAECEYCGSKQTVPTVDDDKKRKLYNGTLRVDLYQFYGERVKRSAITQAKEK